MIIGHPLFTRLTLDRERHFLRKADPVAVFVMSKSEPRIDTAAFACNMNNEKTLKP
jgi:hypothetical protein